MSGVAWTKAQEQVLIDHYPAHGSFECIPRLAALGRIAAPKTVASKANQMGLKNEGFTWKGQTFQSGALFVKKPLKQPPRRVMGPALQAGEGDRSRMKYTVAPTPRPRHEPEPGFVGVFGLAGIGRDAVTGDAWRAKHES